MNDVGFDFRPYDAKSSFALDPMYLSLEELRDVDPRPWRGALAGLKEQFPSGGPRINTRVKAAKLELLRRIFNRRRGGPPEGCRRFVSENAWWLDDYTLYRTLKESNGERAWTDWEAPCRERSAEAIARFKEKNARRIEFHRWVQWQAFEQFRAAKRAAALKGVFLIGDLPFLVSRDSADVWAHQSYFKLDLSAGAPPDLVFSQGQRWGMPPYRWEMIAAQGYAYLHEKLRYASNFYDLFRLDHAVGTFRIWTVPLWEDPALGAARGSFDPPDPAVWEEHGRKLLSVMLGPGLLPCAEDLGTVPDCCPRVLAEFGIPGTEVQRWTKNWGTGGFSPPEAYRPVSVAVLSTHDTSSFAGWWEVEAGTTDEHVFRSQCGAAGVLFEQVRERLFDEKRSRHGRLRWKDGIRDFNALREALGPFERAAGALADPHGKTHGEKEIYWHHIGMKGPVREKTSFTLVERALRAAQGTASIFGVQMIHDWLALDRSLELDPWEFRINFPGTSSDRNWSVVLPLSLEALKRSRINGAILAVNEETGRIP